MGAILVLSFAPLLLFALLGGVAGDRLPRVRVMLASDLARGLVVSVVAGLALAGRLEVWHVFAASVIFGIADAFFQPAYSALIPTILAADDLPSGNAINSLGIQFGRIAGPALGAALIATAAGLCPDRLGHRPARPYRGVRSRRRVDPPYCLARSGASGCAGSGLNRLHACETTANW